MSVAADASESLEKTNPYCEANELTPVPPPPPPLHPTNRFGIHISSLTLARYDSNAAVASQQECELVLSGLDGREQYRHTLCPLAPHQPAKARLVDVGTDVESEAQAAAEFLRAQEQQKQLCTKFDPILGDFYCWRRWHDLAAEPVIFSSRDVDSAHQHALPAAVAPSAPHHQRFIPSFQRGVLDDHFFLLAVAAVATNAATFTALFASTIDADRGMLTFRFFRERNAPEFVTIDTLLPCTKAALVGQPQLALGRTDDEAEFWLALLAKAFATFAGSYAHLHRGSTPRVLRHLTGCDCVSYEWTPGALRPGVVHKDLWWVLREATRMNDIVVCTQARTASSAAASCYPPPALDCAADARLRRVDPADEEDLERWTSGLVVHFAVEYDRSKEKCDYASIRERRREPEIHRLVKVSGVHPETIASLCSGSAGSGHAAAEWGPTSARWNDVSREALANPVGSDSNPCVAWLTLEELAANFNTLVIASNCADDAERLVRHSVLRPCGDVAMRALSLPHFLLSVARCDEAAGDDASRWAATVDANFRSIFNVAPNVLDLGDETDDDTDPMSQSATTVSSQRSSLVDVTSGAPNMLVVEVTLSAPRADFSVPLRLHAFRVPRAERQALTKVVHDGVLTHELPLHSRVAVAGLPVQAERAAVGGGQQFVFELEVNTGCYNLVVEPEHALRELGDGADGGGGEVLFSLTALKRHGAENYTMELRELPPHPAP